MISSNKYQKMIAGVFLSAVAVDWFDLKFSVCYVCFFSAAREAYHEFYATHFYYILLNFIRFGKFIVRAYFNRLEPPIWRKRNLWYTIVNGKFSVKSNEKWSM